MADEGVPADPVSMTAEELSSRTGTPVRTIREYQTWRVLHPPTRVGRRGFYDLSHVRRLEAIARLQERGYSIAAMRDLFDAWEHGAGLESVLGVDDTSPAPADEAPVAIARRQLGALLPDIASSAELLGRACSIGLILEDGDRYVARSPALVQLVIDAIDAGVSASAALDLASGVTSGADLAGRAAADLVATAPAEADLDTLVRRGRVLLARAISTHTIDRVGFHLLARSAADPSLAQLVAEVRIGTTPRPTSFKPSDP